MLNEKELAFIKELCDNITVPEKKYSRNPLDDIEAEEGEEDEMCDISEQSQQQQVCRSQIL